MDKLFHFFGDVQHTKLGGGDSFSDQLSCKYTVYILSLIAILSTTRVFVDEPISCFCPSEFTGSQVDFTKKVCWTHNTHFIPVDQEPLPNENDPKNYISYYQWVPLFLACQAMLFYLPRPIWRMLARKSGIRVSDITDASIECQRKSDSDKADKIMRYMVRYMGRYLTEYRRGYQIHSRLGWCRNVWRSMYGNYLVFVYLIIKCLYITNAIGQLFLLNAFLDTDYHLYGFDVIRRMVRGQNWSTSYRFPRVTMCDFHVRTLGNIHRRSVQCTLPMNLFYEIMFIFLWFWFVFVALTSLSSLIAWIVSALHQPRQIDYVHSRLVAMGKLQSAQYARAGKFVVNYLRRDGSFIVYMVATNSNDLIAAELISGLWDQYISTTKSNEALEIREDMTLPINSLNNNQ